MRRKPIQAFRIAVPAVLAIVASTQTVAQDSPKDSGARAAEVMQSVFADRLRDGGSWRQDNDDFEAGSDAAKYWMQVWRNGPGGEVVILDAYAVKTDDTCSALIHVVFTYDPETGQIRSRGFGANGLSGRGTVEHAESVTSIDTTVRLPGGAEVRMRDRENHTASGTIVVHSERWGGEAWAPGRTVTWHRSAAGLPCDTAGARRHEP